MDLTGNIIDLREEKERPLRSETFIFSHFLDLGSNEEIILSLKEEKLWSETFIFSE